MLFRTVLRIYVYLPINILKKVHTRIINIHFFLIFIAMNDNDKKQTNKQTINKTRQWVILAIFFFFCYANVCSNIYLPAETFIIRYLFYCLSLCGVGLLTALRTFFKWRLSLFFPLWIFPLTCLFFFFNIEKCY